jgi:epoxyqueuosine reductase
MGARVFGCDSCQEVCPLNRGARPTTVRDFSSHIAGPDLPIELLLSLEDDEEVRTRFAGSPVLRAKRRGLVRNATIAAANEGAAELLPLLRRLTADADPVVSEQAIQSLRRLESP